ncbi:AAA family ATPase [Mucilaginibacter dorajii]|uniref:ATPase AAA-type core domain-containing protein n=1 Tax=Mucilaginibacter dorajii TaxID=692994 RepID=A0ABP7PM86_9SPHI|nr:ATP-binding protein [Mucilaginibacter dorajii]MCS3733718.1 putative ATPase [Mucilaginibacter dorajii]
MQEELIKRFQIVGLKNYRNANIIFKRPYKILVGENGLGKTTILDVFYYLLTKKWGSLDEIVFDFIELELHDNLIEFSQSELNIYVSYLEKSDRYFDENVLAKFDRINKILEIFQNRIIYLPIFRNLYQQLYHLLDNRYKGDMYDLINRRNLFDKEKREIFKETVMDFQMNDIQTNFLEYNDTHQLNQFKDTCNKYLEETEFVLSQAKGLEIINLNNQEKVDLQYLSSGEKQIINIFSKFFFCHRKDLIFLIDEPELSLSLNWQRNLLPDVINSGNCAFLFAITHSPFIFNNQLKEYAEGLDLYISKQKND